MSHQDHQLVQRDLAGLGQPAGKGMPPRVKGDLKLGIGHNIVEAEVCDRAVEYPGNAVDDGAAIAGLENMFVWLALVGTQQLQHVSGGVDPVNLFCLGDKAQVSGPFNGVSEQLEKFGAAQSGLEAYETEVVGQPGLFQLECIQQLLCFFGSEEAQCAVIRGREAELAVVGREGIRAGETFFGNCEVDAAARKCKTFADRFSGESLLELVAGAQQHVGCDGVERQHAEVAAQMFVVPLAFLLGGLPVQLTASEPQLGGSIEREFGVAVIGRVLECGDDLGALGVGILRCDALRGPSYRFPAAFASLAIPDKERAVRLAPVALGVGFPVVYPAELGLDAGLFLFCVCGVVRHDSKVFGFALFYNQLTFYLPTKEKGLPSEEDKPLKYHGGAGRIRTLGQRLRRPLLYPTELLPRERCLSIQIAFGGQVKNGKKF